MGDLKKSEECPYMGSFTVYHFTLPDNLNLVFYITISGYYGDNIKSSTKEW